MSSVFFHTEQGGGWGRANDCTARSCQVAGPDGATLYLQCQGSGRRVQYRDVPAEGVAVKTSL
jgi:hypothetical protein